MNAADGTPPTGGTSPAGPAHDAAPAVPAAPGRRWTAGRWSLEVRGDELADVRCDGHVMLRAIRAVARDEDWATAWPREVAARTGDDALTLELRIDDLGLDLAGSLRVQVDDADRTAGTDAATDAVDAVGDRLVVELDLEALGDSRTNRTGLVALHPPQLAGTPLHVTHPDGGVSALAFPVQVSPHQPAQDIVGLGWEAGGLALQLALEGEVFEMEDQRNWTDASYKTYSRPLDRPFPYTLAAGEHVRQRLVLTTGAVTSAGSPAPSPTAPIPAGTARVQADGPGENSSEELTWHRGGAVPAIGTGHHDLELADPGWPQRLEAALAAADGSLALWVVSPAVPDPSALAELGRRLAETVDAGADLRCVGIADATRHVTTPELAAALREVVPESVPVAAGARSHYTELNREWETVLAAEPEALAFATTPLFHTLETEQLIEAVAMQRLLAEQLTARAPGLPVHVGPITLRPRFANVATRPQPVPAPAPPVDPRAGTALHEAWTVASAAALSVPGIASLTYEQAPAALVALGRASRPARAIPAGAGEDSTSTEPADGNALVTARSADGLVWAIGDGSALLLANLSDRPRSMRLPEHAGPFELGPLSWGTALRTTRQS